MNLFYGQERAPFLKKDNLFSSSGQKAAILVAASLVSTLLFFPLLAFFGYSYEAGDVAVMDIKSPITVSSGSLSVKKGETVVRDGQIIGESELKRLALIESALKEKSHVVPAAGFFSFTAIFLAISYRFAARNIRKFRRHPKDLLLMSVILVWVLFLIRLSEPLAPVLKAFLPALPSALYRYTIPVAVGPMLVRLLLNSETALVFAGFSSVMAGLFLGGSLEAAAYSLAGGITAAMGVRHCTHRSIVIKAGILLGAVNAAVLLSMEVLKAGHWSDPYYMIISGVLNGLITAVLAVGVAPVLESAFRYTTDIKLLELSRMDHALLKELAVRAPGTHHHSIVIGTLAEAAAESINANPLLARVGAYYHDIGKLKMPSYFIENISSENRHDKLAPSMSALIIVNHIKEGVELARKHRLGAEITDIISQHHGTSMVAYFFEKARTKDAEGAVTDGDKYRYPGPKPQTKEAGIVMLADAIEAASKTLTDPAPDKIRALTQKIVNKIFTDGQLDECELTLKDLHSITESFNRVFAGVYHHRIDYPEPVMLKEEDGQGTASGHDGAQAAALEGKEDGGGRVKRLGGS